MNEEKERELEEFHHTLQQLITINRDNVGVYEMAVDILSNDQYVDICREFASTRNSFIDQLALVLNQYEGVIPGVESINGLMQDVLMNVKNFVLGGDDAEILMECDRADRLTIDAYHSAITQPLPDNVGQMLREQFSQLKGENETMHRLASALQQKNNG